MELISITLFILVIGMGLGLVHQNTNLRNVKRHAKSVFDQFTETGKLYQFKSQEYLDLQYKFEVMRERYYEDKFSKHLHKTVLSRGYFKTRNEWITNDDGVTWYKPYSEKKQIVVRFGYKEILFGSVESGALYFLGRIETNYDLELAIESLTVIFEINPEESWEK
jgi:hypothetical protein